jgi:ribose transport system permease protein
VSKGKIPPFIATLGMQNILNSISLLLTFGASIYYYHDIFQIITESRFLFLPLPVWIAALVFVVTWVMLYKTRFGTNIFGLGGNPEALTLAGVSTVSATVKTYAFVGVIAGISGLITACRVESGQPVVGIGWEFHAVAATLLGGTSLREGRGGIVGTIFGVFLIRVLQNGLNVSGVSTLYQNAIIGFIVLMAIVVDALLRRAKEA